MTTRLYLILLAEVHPEHFGVALRPLDSMKSSSCSDSFLGGAVLTRTENTCKHVIIMEPVQRRAGLSEQRAATYGDVAVRFDLVNPEAVLHQGARPAKQLLQLPQRERPHLHKQSQARSNRLSAQVEGLTGVKRLQMRFFLSLS